MKIGTLLLLITCQKSKSGTVHQGSGKFCVQGSQLECFRLHKQSYQIEIGFWRFLAFLSNFYQQKCKQKNQNQKNKNGDQKIEFMSLILDFGAPKFWLSNFFSVFFIIKCTQIFDTLKLDPSRMESYARHLSSKAMSNSVNF